LSCTDDQPGYLFGFIYAPHERTRLFSASAHVYSSLPPRERFVCVRLVRLVALVIVLATVYFAQYLFDTTSLADFFPAWLLAWWPALGAIARWLPDDIVQLATWLTLLGLLSFGLLAPWWQGERGRTYRRLPPGRAFLRAWWWGAQILLSSALVCAVAVALLQTQGPLSVAMAAVWAVSLLLYAIGGVIANLVRPPVVYGEYYVENVRPWDGWPYCLVILLLLAVVYSYRLLDLPIRVDALSARVGLAAQLWVNTLHLPSLTAAPNDLPLPTLGLSALFELTLHDNLLAMRVAAVATALGLVTAVWLLGTELFRRVPIYGLFGEILEDDGRWLALMAMLVVGVSLPLLHWARVSWLLEPAVLGTFALWALLRGLRRDRPLLLGVSALTLGWALFYGALGLLFALMALLVWCGVSLLESSWLTGKRLARASGEAVPVQRGVGWRGFGYWLAGVAIIIMPLLSKWVTTPGAFATQWLWPANVLAAAQGGILLAWHERLEMTALGLNQLGDATTMLNYEQHFVSSLLAPLLALSLGALFLNIDSLVGWTLATWLLTGVVVAGLTAPVVPSWVAMVALLPAIGLAVAFVLDRLRLHIMSNAGTWTLQATVYLALGLVVTAGFWSWIDFYTVAQNDSDLPSAVGRAVREAGDEPIVVVSANVPLEATMNEPVVRLLAVEGRDLTQVPTVNARNWSPLSPGTRLLLAPGDSALQAAMEAAYPNGSLTVMRDLHANPLLYIYDLVDSASYPE
jgi:hypothetical protein